MKPYFYYRQQYPVPSKSNEVSADSTESLCKEVSGEVNNVNQAPAQTEVENQPGEPVPDKEKTPEPKLIYEHSRFQEVEPGVFQFKKNRPNMVRNPLASAENCFKQPEIDGYVRIGTFPGANAHGLPVYQFT